MYHLDKRNRMRCDSFLFETLERVFDTDNAISEHECADSNWLTNMYLIYTNEYLSWETFYEHEILPHLPISSMTRADEAHMISQCENLRNLFCATAHLGGEKASWHQIGETLLKMLDALRKI